MCWVLCRNMTLSPSDASDYLENIDPVRVQSVHSPTKDTILAKYTGNGYEMRTAPKNHAIIRPKSCIEYSHAILVCDDKRAQLVWCKQPVMVSVLSTDGNVLAVTSARPEMLPTINVGTNNLMVRILKKPCPHTPVTTDLHDLALDVLEPGVSMWYSHVGHGKFIAILQDTETGRFCCVHRKCTATFSSLKEWRQHYSIPFPKCNAFKKALFHNGVVSGMVGCKFARIAKSSSRPKIPQGFKSLLDPHAGKHMRQSLYTKLSSLQNNAMS